MAYTHVSNTGTHEVRARKAKGTPIGWLYISLCPLRKLGKNTVVVEPRSGENSARGGKEGKKLLGESSAEGAGTRRARALTHPAPWAGARRPLAPRTPRAAPPAACAPAGGEEG